MEMDRRSDTDRQTVDAGDHRLFGQRQLFQETSDIALVNAPVDRIVKKVLHVVAGGEAFGRAEKHMHTHGLIGVAILQRRHHGSIHLLGQRVLLFRPVETYHLNAAVIPVRPFDKNMVAHLDPPMTPAPGAHREGSLRPG